MLACGMDPKGVMAELTGRRAAIPRARAARCTCSRREKHFYGGHGIVGAQVPLGAGLAFADKYRGNGRVTFTYFGDGAANQGQVYETFNMAELWKLPVIFVIENNQYAMGTSSKRSTKSPVLLGARRGLRHPRRGGRRDGRAGGEGGGREGGGALPRAARARTSSRSRPTAIAAIRCPTRPSTAPAKRSRRCARSATRSSTSASCC
jgi:hypothetical protein